MNARDETQEPVAWGFRNNAGAIYDCISPEAHAYCEGDYTIPLYAFPPQRQPLTPGAIRNLYARHCDPVEFARAVEAFHNIAGHL